MRAAVQWGPKEFTTEVLPDPAPAPNEAVVRVDRCGICGTDVHQARSPLFPIPPTGMVLGHEVAGEVVAVGTDVAADLVGRRVAVEHLLPCGECLLCRDGRVNLCPDRTYFMSLDITGGYAEYVLVDARMCIVVDQAMDISMVAMIEPMAVAEHAVQRSGAGPGARVAVLGAGPIGALCVVALRAAGVEAVVASDPAPARRALAAAVGADRVVDPGSADLREAAGDVGAALGFDWVFDCTGRREAITQALDVVRIGGTVMLVGVSGAAVEVEPAALIRRELVLKASLAYCAYGRAEELVATYEDEVAALLSGHCGLDQVGPTLDRLATDPTVGKVLVDPSMP